MHISDLPEIPSSALFNIPVLEREITLINYVYLEDGYFAPVAGEKKQFEQEHMTAIWADKLPHFPMNGSGNGNRHLLEIFQEIPLFFLNETGWLQSPAGFYFVDPYALRGKIQGKKYLLAVNPATKIYLWQDGRVEFLLKNDHTFHSGIETAALKDQDIIDMGPYYLMRLLLDGILSDKTLHNRLTDSD